jgi:hypothetical protein
MVTNKIYPTVRVVLHGGLGNQLFQFFIATALAIDSKASVLKVIPGLLGQYDTSRGLEIQNLINEANTPPQFFLSKLDLLTRCRFPKIAKRIFAWESVFRIPGYGVLLDGYFQELRFFKQYNFDQLASILKCWRSTLAKQGLLLPPQRSKVMHIRLGDFFKSPTAARQFVRDRLIQSSGATDLVTDQEDLVAEVLAKLQLSVDVKLRVTAGTSAWNLFAILSSYKNIETNGSSLALWAAVLSPAEFQSSNLGHMEIWRFLTK